MILKKYRFLFCLLGLFIFLLPAVALAGVPTVTDISSANLSITPAGTNTWALSAGTSPAAPIGQTTVIFSESIKMSSANDIVLRAFNNTGTQLTIINATAVKDLLFSFSTTNPTQIGKIVNETFAQVVSTMNANVIESADVARLEFDLFSVSTSEQITVKFLINQTTVAAPTNAILNDIVNTFAWTNVSGYTSISDYEYSVDNGVTWNQCTANPQPVGNQDYAVGSVQVRVKADIATNRPAGAVLSSNVAFTNIKYGDCNNDGNITTQDITLLRRVVAQVIGYSTVKPGAGDVNRDGNITTQDITLLRRVVAGVPGYQIDQVK